MEAVTKMENYFGQHPYIGAIISGVHLAAGFTFRMLQVSPAQIPPIIMQSAQLGAWIMAIAAGAFTCYGVWKTHHSKKAKK